VPMSIAAVKPAGTRGAPPPAIAQLCWARGPPARSAVIDKEDRRRAEGGFTIGSSAASVEDHRVWRSRKSSRFMVWRLAGTKHDAKKQNVLVRVLSCRLWLGAFAHFRDHRAARLYGSGGVRVCVSRSFRRIVGTGPKRSAHSARARGNQAPGGVSVLRTVGHSESKGPVS